VKDNGWSPATPVIICDFGFVRSGDPISRFGDNRHSEITSDKSDQSDLTDDSQFVNGATSLSVR
jgi:hypothetical protein